MPKQLQALLSTAFREQLTEVGGTEGGEAVLAALSGTRPQRVSVSGPAASTFTLALARMALSKGLRIQLRCDDDPSRQLWQKLLTENLVLIPPAPAILLDAIHELQAWQKHSQQTVFGHYTLADLLALQEQTVKENGRNLLTPYLSTLDFRFDVEELLDYRQKISTSQRLYNKTGPLPELIQELSTGIFYHQTQADSEQFIREKLAEYTSDCHQLLRSFLGQVNAFYWQQQAHYQAIYQRLSRKLYKAEKQQIQLETAYSHAAMQSVPSRLSASLDKKQKALRATINTFYASLADLRSAHEESQAFLLEWPVELTLSPPATWFSLLHTYRQQLSIWYEEIPNQLREESLGLSSRSATEPATASALEILEKQLDELLERINDGGLFQRPLTTQAHTTARQQKQVEQLLEKLLQLQALLDNYPAYYRWQYNWFKLPANLRRILAPLLLLPEDNWAAAFDYWYLKQAIAQRPLSTATPPQTASLAELFQQLATAKASQNSQAKAYSLLPDQLVLANGESEEAVDLVIDLRPATADDAPTENPKLDVPCLHLQALGEHGIPNSFYLWQQADYSAAMVFFCPWSSSRLPDWQAQPHPADFYQLSLLLSQYLLEAEAPSAQTLALRASLADLSATHQGAILLGVDAAGALLVQDLNQALVASLAKACLVLPTSWTLPELLGLPLQHLADLLYRVPSLCIIHALPPDTIQQALLTDGLNSAFLLATFLRSSEAIKEQDSNGFQAMAAEQRHRIGLEQTKRPALLESLLPLLQTSFPNYRLLIYSPWRDTLLPLVLESPLGQRHILLLDGLLPNSKGTFAELDRQEMLLAAGFKLHYLYSEDLLASPKLAVEALRKAVENSAH